MRFKITNSKAATVTPLLWILEELNKLRKRVIYIKIYMAFPVSVFYFLITQITTNKQLKIPYDLNIEILVDSAFSNITYNIMEM